MTDGVPQPGTGDGTTQGRFALPGLDQGSGEPQEDGDEQVPAVLGGRYDVGRSVGSGGTAWVYRAYDRRLHREVAIKLFRRDSVAVEQRRRLHEIQILSSLDHEGIVPLYDTGVQNGHTYIVMRLVEGQDLASRLLAGPLPPHEVVAMATQLTGAVAYVHERGVTHRDLKPANILLDEQGPLIGDFGIAHTVDATRVTATGAVAGTAAYLAPEQVLGEPVGPPADIYSLGLVLLECLTSEREYTGSMAEAALARLARQPRIPADLPADMAEVLRRMTSRDPASRPTAATLHHALTTRTPLPPLEAGAAQVSDRPSPRRRRWLIAAPVAIAGAMGFFVVAQLTGIDRGPSPTPVSPNPPSATPSATPQPSVVPLVGERTSATQPADQVPAAPSPKPGKETKSDKVKPDKGKGKPKKPR